MQVNKVIINNSYINANTQLQKCPPNPGNNL